MCRFYPLSGLSCRAALLSVLVIACNLAFVHEAVALQRLEESTGVRQRFSSGYGARQYGERFHAVELGGPTPTAYETVDIIGPRESAIQYEEPETPARWRIYRQAGFSTTYDSNLFGSRIDPKDDVITTYRGRLGIGRREKMYYVRLFNDIVYSRYVENGKSNNYSYTQTTEFGYTFNRLTINIANSFTPQESVAVGERTELGPAGSTVFPFSDSAHFAVSYRVSPKTSTSFSYGYSLFYFPVSSNTETAQGFGNQAHTFGPGISYQWTPKTKLYAGHSWGTIDYFEDQANKSWTNFTAAGFTHRINPKTTIDFGGGFGANDYKSGSESTSYLVRSAIFRRITPKISGSLYWSRDLSEDLDVARSSSLSRFHETFGAGLAWGLTPRQSVFADASATFSSSDGLVTKPDIDNPTLLFTRYPEDEVYRWAIGWGWQPRPNFSVFLGYAYANHNSSFKDGEFQKHGVVGGIDTRF